MSRTTRKDVEAAVKSYRDAIRIVTGWELELELTAGSATYGNAWSLMQIQEDGSGKYPVTPPGFHGIHLGFTAKDAEDKIRTVSYALMSMHSYRTDNRSV